MGARGKESEEAQSVAAPLQERLQPPDYLSDFQRTEWLAIVNRMPADWFKREHVGLLAQYVRHMENAYHAGRLLKVVLETPDSEMTSKLVQSFTELTKAHDREGRAMANLATKMRLTQQAQYTHTKAAVHANKGKAGKPWDEPRK